MSSRGVRKVTTVPNPPKLTRNEGKPPEVKREDLNLQPLSYSRGVERNSASNLVKYALLGLFGTGLAGNGYWTYQNQLDHINNATSFNERLQTEELKVDVMSGKIAELNKELGTRITLDQMTGAVAMITPSTVRVEGESALGSGVILIGENGERYILTNGHVTEENEIYRDDFSDSVYHIKLYNGTDYENAVEFDAAPVMLSSGTRAFSPPGEHDLALLLIPPDVKLPPNLGVRMRDISANPLRVGEPVIAVGNPFGERDSVSIGSISHIDRESGLNINHHIQTDAPINPGNSGGGLFSIRIENGKPIVELVGINTWAYMGGDGIGGSIRVDHIQKVFNEWGISI